MCLCGLCVLCLVLQQEDEEWEDFAEEHTPDLSGLKIQSLSKMKQ